MTGISIRSPFKILDISYKILTGPALTFKAPGGKVTQFPALVYRAKLQTFQGHDGKVRQRLKALEGEIAAVKSTRETGDIITSYALGERETAKGLMDDAWYSEIFNDSRLKQIYDKGHLIRAGFGAPTHPLTMAPQLRFANRRSKIDGRWFDAEQTIFQMLKESDVVSTKSGLLVARRDLPASEDPKEVEVVKPGKAWMTVELPYTDHDFESSLVPRDFVSHVAMLDPKLGDKRLTVHVWNSMLSDAGLEANAVRKKGEKSDQGKV